MPVFDGTAARQLVLIDDSIPEAPKVTRWSRPASQPRLRLMQKDLYAELHRRRRRAQIAARRLVEDR